jgi:hypothetical protein
MHVTLVLEQGLLGWLIVMGIVAATVRGLQRTLDRLKELRSQAMVRGLMASIVGFLVSMNVMDTFHSPPIQIFFWSLIGIALGIVVKRQGRRRNLIWRFGDAGD